MGRAGWISRVGGGVFRNDWDLVESLGSVVGFDESSESGHFSGYSLITPSTGYRMCRGCFVMKESKFYCGLCDRCRDVKRTIVFIEYRLKHNPQRYNRGENSPKSKLTADAVTDIRANYAPRSEFSTYALARKYGVTQGTIYQVVTGSTWSHVGGNIIVPKTHIQVPLEFSSTLPDYGERRIIGL